jgi:hypothetical protein
MGAFSFLLEREARNTASVVKWSEFLATDSEIPGSTPGLPEFLSSGFGTRSTQLREDN